MGLYHYTVDLTWPGPGSPGVNVWDIRQQALDPTAELQAAVNAIDTFYTSLTSAANFFARPYTAKGRNEAIEINSRTIEPVTGFTRSTSATTVSYSGLDQMIITIRTSLAARRGRGRKFIGPVAGSLMDSNGTPTSGALTTLQTAADALLTASLAGNGWAIGVYSSVDGLFRDATVMTARDYFASLRSRRD